MCARALQEDNVGLVKLVVESQTKRNVQRLTQTYLTLSLEDIAAAVNLPSAATAELVILRFAWVSYKILRSWPFFRRSAHMQVPRRMFAAACCAQVAVSLSRWSICCVLIALHVQGQVCVVTG